MKRKMLKNILCCILAASTISLIAGCSSDDANNTGTTSSKVSEDINVTTNNDNNEETSIGGEISVDKEPLDIETPGGAVLIGRIEKDEEGWYFVPEQPLNLKLTYYIENVEEFDNVTRIEMLSTSEDGFDKVVYEKQLVTISGIISNPRGAGVLYLVPYKIENGKKADCCYAVSDLQAPIYGDAGYDESLLPVEMKIKTENGNYVYNPYLLPEEALCKYGNEFADFYVDFVDAYLNYETSIECPKKDYADYLSVISFYELPMFSIDTTYNSLTWYDENTKTITWKYTKTKEEHMDIIDNVKKASEKFLNGIKETDTEKEKALKLFQNFIQDMQYDYSAQETRDNVDSYYAYANNSGVCVTFAMAYSQMLTQVGIESTLSSATTGDTGSHCWNVITIDGINYFADTTYQITTDKNSNKYFGMSLSDRLNDGSNIDKNVISIGKYNIRTIYDIQISENNMGY